MLDPKLNLGTALTSLRAGTALLFYTLPGRRLLKLCKAFVASATPVAVMWSQILAVTL